MKKKELKVQYNIGLDLNAGLIHRIDNLDISLTKKDTKIKNQAEKLTELNRVYGIANGTVAKQIELIVAQEIDMDTMEKHYDSHMAIVEKEIKRLQVIINYYETKDLK